MSTFRAGFGALVLIAAVTALSLVGPANGQAGRQLTVEPSTGLENQVVRASWSGFRPTVDGQYTVTLFQCRGVVPTSVDDCYQVFRPPGTDDDNGTGVGDALTQADGTGTAVLEIRPALQLPVLECTSRTPCSLLAFENDGEPYPEDGLPVTGVTARLEFAPSPTDCPRVDTPDLTTAGEASTSHALYVWSAQVCTGSDSLALDYTESSSPDGRENFLAGLIDVGLTSTPATDEEAGGSLRKFTYAPIDLTGVVVAFNVTDNVTGQRITEMNLTPRLVAILIAGSQFGGPGESLFADSEFLALNPDHAWPAATKSPLLRAERNADTLLMTRWLDLDDAARRFLDGNDDVAEVDPSWKGIDYPTDIFEARNPSTLGSYNPRTGTLTNARRLFNLQAPGDGQLASPFFEGLLGVMDLVTARKFGFPVARLVPANAPAGTSPVAPDDAGLTAGYGAMKTAPDGITRTADSTALSGYPLVKIDYAMVPTDGVPPADAAEIAQFLEYATTTGQGAGILSSGYLPLPADLKAQAAAAIRAVISGSRPAPTDPPTTPGARPTGPPSGPTDPLPLDPGPPFANNSFESGQLAGPGIEDGEGLDDGLAADEVAGPKSGDPTRIALGADGARNIGDFPGGDGQGVLPVLVYAGLAALVMGPGLTLFGRRKRRSAPSVP